MLAGPVYFSRAARLVAYEGVLRARYLAEEEDAGEPRRAAPADAGVMRVPDEVLLAQLSASGHVEAREE